MHDDPLSGGHLGLTKTYGRLRQRYYWEGSFTETEAYVKSCVDCQAKKKPNTLPAGLLQPIEVGEAFSHWGIDLITPI